MQSNKPMLKHPMGLRVWQLISAPEEHASISLDINLGFRDYFQLDVSEKSKIGGD